MINQEVNPIGERPKTKREVRKRRSVREHMLDIVNAFEMERRIMTRTEVADLNGHYLTCYSAKGTSTKEAWGRAVDLGIVENPKNQWGRPLKESWVMTMPKETADNLMATIGEDGHKVRKVGAEQLSSPLRIVREAAQREVEKQETPDALGQQIHSMDDSIAKAFRRKNVLERVELLSAELNALKDILKIML